MQKLSEDEQKVILQLEIPNWWYETSNKKGRTPTLPTTMDPELINISSF